MHRITLVSQATHPTGLEYHRWSCFRKDGSIFNIRALHPLSENATYEVEAALVLRQQIEFVQQQEARRH